MPLEEWGSFHKEIAIAISDKVSWEELKAIGLKYKQEKYFDDELKRLYENWKKTH